MLGRWFRRRARVERVEPLLLAPSVAHTATGAAISEPPAPTPALGRPDSDSNPRRIHAPGAQRAPEGASQKSFPELSSPELSRMHARLLLGWVIDSDWGHPDARADVVAVEDGKPVLLASALLEIYREMCVEKGIAERPWNPVAKELRGLTGDRKGYAWVERDGAKHRLRVYRIDIAASLVAAPGSPSAPEGARRQAA